MRGIQAAMDDAETRGEYVEHVLLHHQLHFEFFVHCGLPRLVSELERVWEHLDYYRAAQRLSADNTPHDLRREHVALVEAARRGNVDKVLALSEKHRNRSLQIIEQRIRRTPSG
jgi:DNA-binding GntR family transcriptional regulator